MSGNIHPLPLQRYVEEITKSLLSKSSYKIDETHWWLWEARSNDIINMVKYNFFQRDVTLDSLRQTVVLN